MEPTDRGLKTIYRLKKCIPLRIMNVSMSKRNQYLKTNQTKVHFHHWETMGENGTYFCSRAFLNFSALSSTRSWSALIRAAVSRTGCLMRAEADGLRSGSGWIISWNEQEAMLPTSLGGRVQTYTNRSICHWTDAIENKYGKCKELNIGPLFCTWQMVKRPLAPRHWKHPFQPIWKLLGSQIKSACCWFIWALKKWRLKGEHIIFLMFSITKVWGFHVCTVNRFLMASWCDVGNALKTLEDEKWKEKLKEPLLGETQTILPGLYINRHNTHARSLEQDLHSYL